MHTPLVHRHTSIFPDISRCYGDVAGPITAADLGVADWIDIPFAPPELVQNPNNPNIPVTLPHSFRLKDLTRAPISTRVKSYTSVAASVDNMPENQRLRGLARSHTLWTNAMNYAAPSNDTDTPDTGRVGNPSYAPDIERARAMQSMRTLFEFLFSRAPPAVANEEAVVDEVRVQLVEGLNILLKVLFILAIFEVMYRMLIAHILVSVRKSCLRSNGPRVSLEIEYRRRIDSQFRRRHGHQEIHILSRDGP